MKSEGFLQLEDSKGRPALVQPHQTIRSYRYRLRQGSGQIRRRHQTHLRAHLVCRL